MSFLAFISWGWGWQTQFWRHNARGSESKSIVYLCQRHPLLRFVFVCLNVTTTIIIHARFVSRCLCVCVYACSSARAPLIRLKTPLNSYNFRFFSARMVYIQYIFIYIEAHMRFVYRLHSSMLINCHGENFIFKTKRNHKLTMQYGTRSVQVTWRRRCSLDSTPW